MPSSPETLAPVWEPAELNRPRVGVPTPWSFDTAFVPAVGPAAPTAAPAPFEVSASVGVPAAILAPARQAGQAAAREAGADEAAAVRARAEQATADARVIIERAAGALGAAVSQLAGRATTTLADVEQLVLDAAYDIAEAVVGASLRHDPVRGATAVARALALVPETDGVEVTVALHPADHATVVAAGGLPDGVRVVPDASLTPGDALATCGATSVDAAIAAGLARVREVLAR